MLLGAVGLSAVLASCGSVTVDDSLGIRSQYQLSTDVTDVNTGRVLKQGTYVICDNKNTNVELNVSWTAGTSAINLLAYGEYYGEGKYLANYKLNSAAPGSAALTFTVGAFTAPQSIIVNPVTTVNVKGYTRLAAQAVDLQGNTGSVQQSSYVLPVVDCL
ncbi:hypothetical protein DEIPH_ctg025orf0032 [Deinococcus phoenicis]|uniref:Uncharacterized protein n=2 Tax=Deinococcus phoenicis TaxID=1476583 RepID=A0A016QQ52_9DEIO|nr:hypothetical protein DEIPH_ctg025orf0032 [Deinococcus phoenicis]